jgi:hypothetical protein
MLDVSVATDSRNASARFDVLFSGRPDFYKVDEFGRQRDEFQFEIDGPGVSQDWPFETLIRGGEIHLAGDIRIRNVEPPVLSPEAGGWGAVRGSVGYSLSDNRLSFSVPFDILGAPDGAFSYTAYSVNYGAWNGDEFKGSVVPVPFPAILIVTGVTVLAAIGRRRKSGPPGTGIIPHRG